MNIIGILLSSIIVWVKSIVFSFFFQTENIDISEPMTIGYRCLAIPLMFIYLFIYTSARHLADRPLAVLPLM